MDLVVVAEDVVLAEADPDVGAVRKLTTIALVLGRVLGVRPTVRVDELLDDHPEILALASPSKNPLRCVL